ncbi:MAG: polysaccharide deacetylase family protein [Spirochaetes bacterium]|nr:polysaccharide deacetylase family protein [Spirochaetota bacterium]MBN2771302.1 polysaccharide deacetylase family protein [Spirochaetota bacterium]
MARLIGFLICLIILQYSCSSLNSIIVSKENRYKSLPPGRLVCPESRLKTNKKVIALTFDACGGRGACGYDKELIDYLKNEKIKATLFLNIRWIKKNRSAFNDLVSNPLFQIENHGLKHKPASINGASMYGVRGTSNIRELVEEVEISARIFKEYGARKPKYFRSGTAWYDETSIRIIESMGYKILNFDTNSHDFDKTKTATEISEKILKAKEGSIVIMHMNHPGRNTAEALKLAVPQLREMGYKFVKINEYRVQTSY